MRVPIEYSHLRDSRSALVKSAVSPVIELTYLRGSWVSGDFHLGLTDGLSFSDVDLALSEAAAISHRICQSISHNLIKTGFPLRVSAHREEALGCVTLEDARILKIAEYLSKTLSAQDNLRLVSYWRAKTVLLLLQSKVNEGYGTISARLGTKDARSALAVKLGIEPHFSRDSAARLIKSFGNEIARDFMDHCIARDPDSAYGEQIAARLRQCKSVSPWLLDYVLEKMGLKAT